MPPNVEQHTLYPNVEQSSVSPNVENASEGLCSIPSDGDITDAESVLAILPSAMAQDFSCDRLLTLMLTCCAAHAANPLLPAGDSNRFESAFVLAFQEPVSYAAAMRATDAQQWIAAMNEKKEAFYSNSTWEIVDVDPTWKLLSSKWVLSSSVMSGVMSQGTEHGWLHVGFYNSRAWILATSSHRWSDIVLCV